MGEAYGSWEPVIGLEIHAQLLTRSKCFCACATSFGDPPNTHTCPVCLGLPGALPVLNREALRMAIVASIALSCRVQSTSIFARKNYFYPDLPKGYQISQYERPLALGGELTVATDQGSRRVGITRVHMEEDAGKNLHGVGGESLVDLNRAGTALIEIVSEPDLRAAGEAREYMKRLREILMFAGVNDGNLEHGSFRCDANVSVRKRGDQGLGTRVEMKNINSFRFVEEAIDVEIRRQIRLRERGESFVLQTRGYNADKRESYLLREKEGDAGYRYFPEPDLPPLVADESLVAELRETMPELPEAKRARYQSELGLSAYAASVMSSHPAVAALFETATELSGQATRCANFIQAELMRDLRTEGLEASSPLSSKQLAELVTLVESGRISGKQSKQIYRAIAGSERMPRAVVEELGLEVLSDEATLRAVAQELVGKHPDQASKYRGGKTKLLGFFVGQLMKATQGNADPAAANRLLREVLAGDPEGQEP